MNSRDITIILAVVLGVILVVPVLSMSTWGYGMMGPGMTGRGMMGGYGLLIVVLVLLGLVLLVHALTVPAALLSPRSRRLHRKETHTMYPDSASAMSPTIASTTVTRTRRTSWMINGSYD